MTGSGLLTLMAARPMSTSAWRRFSALTGPKLSAGPRSTTFSPRTSGRLGFSSPPRKTVTFTLSGSSCAGRTAQRFSSRYREPLCSMQPEHSKAWSARLQFHNNRLPAPWRSGCEVRSREALHPRSSAASTPMLAEVSLARPIYRAMLGLRSRSTIAWKSLVFTALRCGARVI